MRPSRTTGQACRPDARLDDIQEPDKLLVPVALHVAADHRAVGHVQGNEQGGGGQTRLAQGEVSTTKGP